MSPLCCRISVRFVWRSKLSVNKFDLKAQVFLGSSSVWSSTATFDSAILDEPPPAVIVFQNKLVDVKRQTACSDPARAIRAAFVLAAEDAGRL